MWVKFNNLFNWRPRAGVVQAFPAGLEANVTHECGEAAIAGGFAVAIKTPTKPEVAARKNVSAKPEKNLKVEVEDGS